MVWCAREKWRKGDLSLLHSLFFLLLLLLTRTYIHTHIGENRRDRPRDTAETVYVRKWKMNKIVGDWGDERIQKSAETQTVGETWKAHAHMPAHSTSLEADVLFRIWKVWEEEIQGRWSLSSLSLFPDDANFLFFVIGMMNQNCFKSLNHGLRNKNKLIEGTDVRKKQDPRIKYGEDDVETKKKRWTRIRQESN